MLILGESATLEFVVARLVNLFCNLKMRGSCGHEALQGIMALALTIIVSYVNVCHTICAFN